MQSEGASPNFGRHTFSQESVAWCTAKSFSAPVKEASRQHLPPVRRDADERLRNHGERVTRNRERLPLPDSVGKLAGVKPKQTCHAFRDALNSGLA